MSMPRVLMFCGNFWPLIGGAERQAEKLARALIKRGCHVEILTPQLESNWPLEENLGGLIVHRFPYTNLTKGLKIRGLGVPNTLYLSAQTKRAVRQLINEFDILHAHIATPMVAFAMVAAHESNKKVICKIACGGKYFDFRSLAVTSLLGKRLVKKLTIEMDQWVAISNEVRSNLLEAGVGDIKIAQIPNGVDVSPLERKENEDVRNFLYLGRFTHNPQRDFYTLLQAFDLLAKDCPHCELRLVGGGEREQEIRGILKDLPFARDRTQIVGFSDSKQWLEWANVLIQPSIAEGMSNTLLEGMAAELACIANDILPNREVLDDGKAGILVPVGDIAALYAAMKKVALVSGLCKELGKVARTRVEDVYAIERVAEKYLDMYSRL